MEREVFFSGMSAGFSFLKPSLYIHIVSSTTQQKAQHSYFKVFMCDFLILALLDDICLGLIFLESSPHPRFSFLSISYSTIQTRKERAAQSVKPFLHRYNLPPKLKEVLLAWSLRAICPLKGLQQPLERREQQLKTRLTIVPATGFLPSSFFKLFLFLYLHRKANPWKRATIALRPLRFSTTDAGKCNGNTEEMPRSDTIKCESHTEKYLVSIPVQMSKLCLALPCSS